MLSGADALHGDIGIVGRDDLVVMVSKSGATEELLRLVPYVKAGPQPSLCTASSALAGLAALCISLKKEELREKRVCSLTKCTYCSRAGYLCRPRGLACWLCHP